MLPVFHSEDLEYGDKSHCKCFIVGARQLGVLTEVIAALEDLSAQKRVDENEHEHEHCDQYEIHERSLDDADYHGH